MPYAAQSDLVPLRMTQADLVQLTDDTNIGAVNAAVVNAALEDASGLVDSYCRTRYQTPMQASDTLNWLTLDITIYLLFSRRRETEVKETVRQGYDDAIARLKDIRDGKEQLDQPVAATPQTSTASVERPTRPLRFREHNLDGFI
jgi:phage gp36-like protein